MSFPLACLWYALAVAAPGAPAAAAPDSAAHGVPRLATMPCHATRLTAPIKLDGILDDARGAGRPVDAVETVRMEIESIQHEMLAAL